ncbi:MAG: DUF3016 domain-containing protein [Opitutaceae bacterium]|nr:DUF3016 domain-containing protein [Opitutaceae bacterium]
MKTYPSLLLAAALLAGGCQTAPKPAASAAGGNITVTFQQPEKFTDVQEHFGSAPSQAYLDMIADHVKQRAAGLLADGQKLNVTFKNIDLAGDFEPAGRPGMEDVRLVKGIYLPRMSLHFALTDATGAVVREGDRELTDLNFQMNINPIGRSEPLFYDYELLNRWLESEFKR